MSRLKPRPTKSNQTQAKLSVTPQERGRYVSIAATSYSVTLGIVNSIALAVRLKGISFSARRSWTRCALRPFGISKRTCWARWGRNRDTSRDVCWDWCSSGCAGRSRARFPTRKFRSSRFLPHSRAAVAQHPANCVADEAAQVGLTGCPEGALDVAREIGDAAFALFAEDDAGSLCPRSCAIGEFGRVGDEARDYREHRTRRRRDRQAVFASRRTSVCPRNPRGFRAGVRSGSSRRCRWCQ